MITVNLVNIHSSARVVILYFSYDETKVILYVSYISIKKRYRRYGKTKQPVVYLYYRMKILISAKLG